MPNHAYSCLFTTNHAYSSRAYSRLGMLIHTRTRARKTRKLVNCFFTHARTRARNGEIGKPGKLLSSSASSHAHARTQKTRKLVSLLFTHTRARARKPRKLVSHFSFFLSLLLSTASAESGSTSSEIARSQKSS